MKKRLKATLTMLFILSLLALAMFFITHENVLILNPKGWVGEKQRSLFITASFLMLIVVVPVFTFLIWFVWKYRESNQKAKYSPDWEHSYLAESLWWGIPMAIITVLAVITWKSSHELDPYRPLVSDKKPLTIQVIALQWKWLFIYPEQGVASVNFMQFPVNIPISFKITADAPMNSFWIPQLGGQIYAMPGMQTELHLIADTLGDYRGCSANISGKGFAGMNFIARASNKEDFDNWVKAAKESEKKLDSDMYNKLVMPSENDPVSIYSLSEANLFDKVVTKFGMKMAM